MGVGGCEPEHGDHRRVARASGGPRKIRTAQQDKHTGERRGAGEGEPVTGPQGGPVARAFGVGQLLPRKIMPGVDYVPTRQDL